MTLARHGTRLLLNPQDLPASDDRFHVVGAFNPGAVWTGEEVILLVRVAERPKEKRPGFAGLPRWDTQAGLTIDWVPEEQIELLDARVVRRRADGLVRLTFISHLRVVRCGDGRNVREISSSRFSPEGECEEFGVEDPRITQLDGRFYFTYVAVSRHGPATALASTADFRTFQRHGIIFCPENKDVVLFPDRVNGAFAALHRPVCGTPFTRPEMWLARSPDLLHWGGHSPLTLSGGQWLSGRVGAGAPPIRVTEGWLELFHGNQQRGQPGEVGTYYGGALLLDPSDPSRVIGQSKDPILLPETEFERTGFVPNVVFPTGVVRRGGSLLIYYGAADQSTAVAEFAEADILQSLKQA